MFNTDHFAARPIQGFKPRLRFIEGAPEGAPGEGSGAEKDLAAQLAAALAEVEKWKGLSRKNEECATSNAEKAEKFDALEEANKTEQEKLLARAEAAEKKLADREATEAAAKLASDVAAEKSKGLATPIPASALRGATREELEAHADDIIALLPQAPAAPSADGQGSTGNPIGEGEMSPDDIVAAATKR